MPETPSPRPAATRRIPVAIGAVLIGAALGFAGVYGIGGLRRNVGGDPACRPAVALSQKLAPLAHGTPVRMAGLVTLRQRPETASGVTFVTLEDEDGLFNVVVWRDVGERQRRVLLESRLLQVEGRVESADGVQHLIAERLEDLSPLLGGLGGPRSRDFR